MAEQYSPLRPEDISVCDRYMHKTITEKGEMLSFYDIVKFNSDGFTALDREGTIDFKFCETANGILMKKRYLDLQCFMLTSIHIGEYFRKTERGRDWAEQIAQFVVLNKIFPLEHRVADDYGRLPVAKEDLDIPPDIYER